MDLTGRTAFVTGAARGIGKAIAITLGRNGADVAVGDINSPEVKLVSEELIKMGLKSIGLVLDVSDIFSVRKNFEEAKKKLGVIDILVNNAGITTNVATVIKMSEENWNRELSINLSGAFYCTKQVLPDMAERKWGRIINISSGAGTRGGFGQCSYSAAKAGLLGFTKVVALEHARDNITSNALVLGLIRTDAYKAIREDMRIRIERTIPIRRPGEPNEVAEVVAFLASEQASYINGADIHVTAGQEMFTF
jgi:3-oxoacyl-[acyl-carrier protein] reductase